MAAGRRNRIVIKSLHVAGSFLLLLVMYLLSNLLSSFGHQCWHVPSTRFTHSSQNIMERHKSRTLIGRTISRVKSRITSFGSPSDTASPNPLVAPPASQQTIATPTRTPRAFRTVPQRSPTHDTIRAPKTQRPDVSKDTALNVDGAADGLPGSSIASLDIKTATWTVFGIQGKFPATAYVNIDISCSGTSSLSTIISRTGPRKSHSASKMGHLYDLTVTPALIGPGALIKRYGHSTRAVLTHGDRWTLVLHLGIQDTSLAARLSTSFKSLGGRLGRISNVDVINRWLDVLQKDNVLHSTTSSGNLKMQVSVAFKHSLLPTTTVLLEERTVHISMTEDDVERAKFEGFELGGDDEDEDEERIQESRVMGAPWL